MKMKEARWDYKSHRMIRDDIKHALIGCTWKILNDTAASDEIKLARLEGVWELYSAIIPHTEETPDENDTDD